MSVTKPKLLVLYAPTHSTCGIATFSATLSAELEQRGWDVTIGLARGAHFHDPRVFERAHPGCHTRWMDARTGTEEGRVRAIARLIADVRPMVVIDNCIDSAFDAVRRRRVAGDEFSFLVANHGSLPAHAARILANADVVDAVVSVNKLGEIAMAADGRIDRERIHHVPNAVPLPLHPPGRAAHRPRWTVGYAGRLTNDKRFGDVIPFFRALAALRPDVDLWIAGDGELEPEARALANELPGLVRVFGALTREQLYRDFYPQIDVYVHFSAAEGWSLAIGEAMAHGAVPVTSAFRGLFAEGLMQSNVNSLIFPVGDVEAPAALVARLAGDRLRWETLSANAANAVASNYSLTQFGAAWDALLRRVTATPALKLETPAGADDRREGSRETLRRVLRRYFPHKSAGEEWPHFRSDAAADQQRIAAHMTEIERAEHARATRDLAVWT